MYAVILISGPYGTYGVHPTGSLHRFTHWIVRETVSGTVVFSSYWDPVNLYNILTSAVLEDGVGYEALIAHVDAFGHETWSEPLELSEENLDPIFDIQPRSTRRDLFFGTTDAILLADHGTRDRSLPYGIRIKPADVLPAGIGGEVVCGPYYVTLANLLSAQMQLTPRADGRELPPVVLPIPSRPRFITGVAEVDAREDYEPDAAVVSRYGIRGAAVGLVLEMAQLDYPLFAVHNIEVETEVVRECLPGVTFTPEALVDATIDHPVTLFFGGAALYAADRGTEDGGAPMDFAVHSIGGSPAGEGGEAVFDTAYLALLRTNQAAATLEVVPIVDEVDQQPVEIMLPGTAQPVAEIIEIGLEQPYVVNGATLGRYSARGTAIECRVRSIGGLPDGDIILEQLDVEGQAMQETMEPING